MLKKFIAFSLAEVLMVAGIAAVVGAMTIPNMKKSYEKKARIAKAKTTFATLDGAIAQIDNVKVFRGATTTKERSLAMLTALEDNLQFRYVCGSQPKSEDTCFKFSNITDTSNTSGSSSTLRINYQCDANGSCATAILKNGAEIAIYRYTALKPFISENYDSYFAGYYGFVMVDVDGAKKGPHKRGEDIFVFKITGNGLGYIKNSIESELLDN